jgi:hypothetical protein
VILVFDERYKALQETLRADPDAYGLRTELSAAGLRLTTVVEQLASDGITALGPLPGHTPDARSTAFIQRFVDQIMGTANSPADAALRRAAVRCAEDILSDPHVGRAIEQGENSRLSGEIICWIYRTFFATAITNFIQSTIAAKITLIAPWWHLIDPAGKAASWLTNKIMSVIPNPCEETDQGSDSPSLADLARSLLTETVDRALGISPGGAS